MARNTERTLASDEYADWRSLPDYHTVKPQSEEDMCNEPEKTKAAEMLLKELGKESTQTKMSDLPAHLRGHLVENHQALSQMTPGVPFEPLWDWVLVEEIERKATDGGILLPETSTDQDTKRATVVAVGPGTYRDSGIFVPVPLKVGDIVYCMAFAKPKTVGIPREIQGLPANVAGRKFHAVACRDLIGIERVSQ